MTQGIKSSDSVWQQAVALLDRIHQPYVLITLLGVQGSTPRNSGTKMVVSLDSAQSGTLNSKQKPNQEQPQIWGTIGGGHLEYKVMQLAAEMLLEGTASQRLEHFPLGASLGQCCGGRTSVLLESFVGAELQVALFGAGHVGRAVASILSHLPCRLNWFDNREQEFPDGPLDSLNLKGQIPDNVIKNLTDSPADEVVNMPQSSYYLVMTHQHSLDFEIIEQVLKRGDARYVGLIGSQTKWRRFQLRFAHRGYPEQQYQTVRCPVGLQQVPGKRPMEVAVSIAAEIIAEYQSDKDKEKKQQEISWKELKQLAIADHKSADEVKGPG